jgi:hypothetical protein
MTEQDQAGPALADDAPPDDRFKDLPDGVTAELAEERIKSAFARLGAKRLERRARETAAYQAAERSEAVRLNRENALRSVREDDVTHYFGACACRWHGLRVSDPEVALREFDAHPCTIPFDMESDHPAFRDLRTVDGKLVRRPVSVLALNQVMPDGQIINSITTRTGSELALEQGRQTTADEDAELRAALLELK